MHLHFRCAAEAIRAVSESRIGGVIRATSQLEADIPDPLTTMRNRRQPVDAASGMRQRVILQSSYVKTRLRTAFNRRVTSDLPCLGGTAEKMAETWN